MNLKVLQKIAKSDKWQIIYNRAKELGTLRLFDNNSDLSGVQVWFLYLLQMYDILYQDLAEDKEYISKEVIADDIRTEAYLLLRKELRKKKDINKKTSNKKEVTTSGNIPGVIFREKN